MEQKMIINSQITEPYNCVTDELLKDMVNEIDDKNLFQEELVFDFDKLNKLYNEGLLKDHLDAKEFLQKIMYPLTDGSHAMLHDGKVSIIQKETMNEVYFPRFPEAIKKWYKTKTIPKQLICNVMKPQIGNTFINIAPNMFKKRKAYDTFSESAKRGVEKMLCFLKEVWCDDSDVHMKYILSWYSEVLKGKKNSSILYVKSIQGVGKSTFGDFLIEYVIGYDLTAKGDKDCLCTSNNMCLLGKPYVMFEELPVLSKGEWNVCDGKLKDMATGKKMNFSDKYCRKFEAENINNYEIHCNYKAIKNPTGRRYYVVKINTKYCNDHKYFGALRDACFNDEVGYAFYNYLMEIDTNGFKSLDMPDTSEKLDLIADLLTPIEKFLKKEYLLKKKNVRSRVKNLYDEYEVFCNENGLHCETKIEFTTGLKQFGFNLSVLAVITVTEFLLNYYNQLQKNENGYMY
jgi:hypothetical protein